VEFKSADAIAVEHGRLTEMVANRTWGQQARTITDDTEQALCIARSLVDEQAFDPADIADRFVAWYDTGPFDVGVMTARSLRTVKSGVSWEAAGRQVWEDSPEAQNAGNGSVMRSPPLAIPYGADPETLACVSRDASRITHADPRCTTGCAIVNLTIAGHLRDITDALDVVGDDAPDELVTALRPLVAGERPDTLETSGYVVHTLQTALHDGLREDDPEAAIVTAVNRGGDTDTIGAVAGAVAGARAAGSRLPDRWLAEIDEADEIESLADRLVEQG
jgi:ADP-ribosyl-[dinitrogen reductase] hydrolase